MKKFIFKADIEFEAADLDDAFRLLEKEFHDLQDTEHETEIDLWYIGEMDIRPKQ